MKESEKLLERKLKREVEKIGGMCIKFLPFSLNGFPDRMCLFPKGRILFVEVKTTKFILSKLQRFMHSKLKALGFKVKIVDTSTHIDEIIKRYE